MLTPCTACNATDPMGPQYKLKTHVPAGGNLLNTKYFTKGDNSGIAKVMHTEPRMIYNKPTLIRCLRPAKTFEEIT